MNLCTLDIIKELLKANKKTQQELCAYIGVSKQAFTEWNGKRNTSYMKYLPQIAEFFNVSVDYLLGKEKGPSGLPEELLKELSANPAKLELAKLICSFDDEKLDRALKLLDASLLLPKEETKL